MRLLLVLLTLALMTAFGRQDAVAAELPVLDLRAGEDAAALAPFVRFTKQSVGTEAPELASILRRPLGQIQGSTIHFGPPGTKTVVLLKLRNSSAAQGSWILTTGRGSLKHFRLFEAERDRLKLLIDGTNSRDAQQNLGTYQAFSAELVLDPAQEKLILIEFLSENSTYMPLRIVDQRQSETPL